MQGIKALAFDTGGTVLDWHRGIRAALAGTGRRHTVERDWTRITNDYRRRSLQTMTGKVRPGFNIDGVHREVLDAVLAENDLAMFTADDRSAIARTWHELDAWPDFAAASERLRRRFVVASFTILSVALIVDVSRRNRLAWDCVISCEMLDVYKPLPEAYRRAAQLLQLRPEQILMVACHNFDLMAAHREGYRTAFVRRPAEWGDAGPPDPNPDPAIDRVFDGFAELAELAELADAPGA